MELLLRLKKIITTKDFDEKITLAKELSREPADVVPQLMEPSLAHLKFPGRPDDFCIVNPRFVPKRNKTDLQSRINFLHSIANIELLAIELPALCLMRFGSVDLDFIDRQLKIISEEAYHFELLRNRLQDFGCEFGTIPVHHGLWDYAWRCQSELEHQVVIPCYLEARGLDVTPEFIKKFEAQGDTKSAQIMRLILDEEITHVQFGLKYLQKQAQRACVSRDELFAKTLRNVLGDKIKSKIPVNQETRTKAGFTVEQIRVLAS